MQRILTIFALVGAALASPMPQAVTSAISPSASAPAGCSTSHSGTFEISAVNVTSSAARRDVSKRQSDGTLTIILTNSVLTDQTGRTGYIAANRQFQFDKPPQAGAIYTAGFSLCSNNTLALGGSAIFYQCLSGGFYNLYDRSQGGQCNPVYIEAINGGGSASPSVSQASDGQPGATSVVSSVSQRTDGQPIATSRVVTQISDGQPQATTGRPVSQISDGQPQATTGTPVSQKSDGQPQATTGTPVSQKSDGQPQATTGTPVSQKSDGQPQATTGTPVSQKSDGQPQATTGTPVSQKSDGQPQATTGTPVSQKSDGQPQATTGTPVSQFTDGQAQAATGTSSTAIATFTGAADRQNSVAGGLALIAGLVGAVAIL